MQAVSRIAAFALECRMGLWTALGLLLFVSAIVSLTLGRFDVPVSHVAGILAANILPIEPYWRPVEERVVELIRMPRILIAGFAGAGLAIAGAALQGVFRNPLVGPQIIGVSSGAAFGGAFAILISESRLLLIILAFFCGMLALVIVYKISRQGGRTSVLMLVLSGIVTGALFSALVSATKFVADPDDKLPAIVFFLMGSFASASNDKLLMIALPVAAGSALIFMLRYQINVLSMGDEEAQALGMKVEPTRWIILGAVALISAAVVAAAGGVCWVGLVIPHIARMLTGPDHKFLIPASALIGAVYLIQMDNIARTATSAEIPIGIMTALVGAPVFVYLLRRTAKKGWGSE